MRFLEAAEHKFVYNCKKYIFFIYNTKPYHNITKFSIKHYLSSCALRVNLENLIIQILTGMKTFPNMLELMYVNSM